MLNSILTIMGWDEERCRKSQGLRRKTFITHSPTRADSSALRAVRSSQPPQTPLRDHKHRTRISIEIQRFGVGGVFLLLNKQGFKVTARVSGVDAGCLTPDVTAPV